VPVIWGGDGIASVAAARWKTQFNENAKVPAWASSLPELDHNEVVGWTRPAGDGYMVIALRDEDEHPDVAARFPLSARHRPRGGLRDGRGVGGGRSALARCAR
jgi:glucose/mannose-6-phosphate isomerase